MSKFEQIENIHNNLINGNRQDCVKQIQDYGLYEFWKDYIDYLSEMDEHSAYTYFADMTISYFRITNR